MHLELGILRANGVSLSDHEENRWGFTNGCQSAARQPCCGALDRVRSGSVTGIRPEIGCGCCGPLGPAQLGSCREQRRPRHHRQSGREADRAFLREVLDYPYVDAGADWLIFKLPPAEIAVHPRRPLAHELDLMCDDLDTTMEELALKERRSPQSPKRWGRLTSLHLPGGGEVGLYEPRHPRATDL